MEKTLVVSFLSQPNTGKSTLAAEIFAVLKKKQEFNVELVTEYAKDLVWDNKSDILENNQLLVSGNQFERLRRLVGKVDIIIQDTSLLLGAIFEKRVLGLEQVLLYYYNLFNNLNFFLEYPENVKFSTIGRVEKSLEETRQVGKEIIQFLNRQNIPFIILNNKNKLEQAIKEIERLWKK